MRIFVNPNLTVQQPELLRMLVSFSGSFAMSSKAQQTTVAKHPIIFNQNKRPTHQLL